MVEIGICYFIGTIFTIIIWILIPYTKLNRLIVYLNRNRKVSSCCNWISDSFQALLCVTESRQYLVDTFTIINTKNKIYFDSLCSIRIHVTLTARIYSFQDDMLLDEVNESLFVYFIYKEFKWTVISVERDFIVNDNK